MTGARARRSITPAARRTIPIVKVAPVGHACPKKGCVLCIASRRMLRAEIFADWLPITEIRVAVLSARLHIDVSVTVTAREDHHSRTPWRFTQMAITFSRSVRVDAIDLVVPDTDERSPFGHLRAAIRDAMLHEIDECFYLDKVRVWDPHREESP
jgi:hypothetical protein